MNDVWTLHEWAYEDWAQRGELWQLGQVSDGLAEGEVEVEVEGRICTPPYPEAFGRGFGQLSRSPGERVRGGRSGDVYSSH